MKTILPIIAGLLLAGCTTTKLSSGSWTLERTTLFQKADIGEVAVSPDGSAKLKGYKNDGGNEALGVAVEAAVTAAVKSVKP